LISLGVVHKRCDLKREDKKIYEKTREKERERERKREKQTEE
jgi:hypothetical protein